MSRETDSGLPARAGVVVPVGPGRRELNRLADLLDSVRACVHGLDALVLVDDAAAPRGLAALVPPGLPEPVVLRPARLRRAGHAFDAMTVGTLTFAAWLAREHPVDYLVKLDTDALVIGDFRPSLQAAIAASAEVGLWGAHRFNRTGSPPRDFTVWHEPLRRMLAPVAVHPRRWRRLPGLRLAVRGRALRARRFLGAAVADAERHGYELGEHCLGGAYALTWRSARAMHERGFLDDPLVLSGSRLGEDVVLGLLTRAAGLRLESLVGEGDAFAVAHQGLLASPDELVAGGHAVVHSVKDSSYGSEAALRARFRSLRGERIVRELSSCRRPP